MTSVFFCCLKRSVAILVAISVVLLLFELAFIKLFYPICYYRTIKTYCDEYNLEPQFVLSIVNAESGFDRFATSQSGAVGLMQVMPQTASDISQKLDVKNYSRDMLYDEEVNIRFGCYYLRYLFDKFSDKVWVLYAYNAGEGNLAEELASNPSLEMSKIQIGETRNYVERVMSKEKVYKNLLKFYKEQQNG